MSQKKALGTVSECTEICDDSVSLLDDAKLEVQTGSLNSSGLSTGKEQIVTSPIVLNDPKSLVVKIKKIDVI
ncbi:unnamed protein product [Litomosoides sigmodontis]|uniref:Uncharacterized protein n=1 Tax=Litomosoides sigmodontis TaxID=42156 RepID=A0A3P6U3J9_LITSI|nr:unnamed protein product [Litomosoides sigmodontis]